MTLNSSGAEEEYLPFVCCRSDGDAAYNRLQISAAALEERKKNISWVVSQLPEKWMFLQVLCYCDCISLNQRLRAVTEATLPELTLIETLQRHPHVKGEGAWLRYNRTNYHLFGEQGGTIDKTGASPKLVAKRAQTN